MTLERRSFNIRNSLAASAFIASLTATTYGN
jgi:hypothetical protein